MNLIKVYKIHMNFAMWMHLILIWKQWTVNGFNEENQIIWSDVFIDIKNEKFAFFFLLRKCIIFLEYEKLQRIIMMCIGLKHHQLLYITYTNAKNFYINITLQHIVTDFIDLIVRHGTWFTRMDFLHYMRKIVES
jgi:hypothetical protein